MSIGLLPKVLPRNKQQRQADMEHRLITMEAEIGGKLFGPIPKGHKRHFFCLDEHTWIWQETWMQNGQRHTVNTRYKIRPEGIIKAQDGQGERWISLEEARNLDRAVQMYHQRVNAMYQRMLQPA